MVVRFHEQQQNNGVKYKNFESDLLIAAVTTAGEDRLVLPGKFSITIMDGREGTNPLPDWADRNDDRELQLKIYAKKGSFRWERRNSSDYDRVEICIPIGEAVKLLKELNAQLILDGLLKNEVPGDQEPEV